MTSPSRSYSIIRKSKLFDPVYYLINYPDVRVSDFDPLRHFVKFGWREGRNPSEKFDTTFYVETNPDVKQSGENPLVHYIETGSKEGRKALPSAQYVPKLTIPSQPLQEFPSTKSPQLDHETSVDILGKRPSLSSKVPPDVIEVIDKKISIIIPTKNAGDDFPFLMKVLHIQEGFKEIEIIVVDSGSTDNTIQVAEWYKAKIVKIDPEKFSHSYARNLGAEHATGDYLLFTVQDALPPSSTWLYELFQVLKNHDVVAVSCAETPREDADLFYRQICWNHYNFLGINEGDRIFSLPEKLDNISLRQNAQLSDLANLISKDVFNKYQYRLDYAEDLDLGIRLIKNGHKIAFLGSIRIIHSHNRSPYYFLKRGYVDNQFLSDVFDDFVIPKIYMQEFVPDIAFTYMFLTRLIENLDNLPKPLTPELFETQVSDMFARRYEFEYPGELPVVSEQFLDNQTMQFLENLITKSGFQFAGRKYDGFLAMAFLGYVNITFNYLKNTYESIDDLLMTEIKVCLNKAFSIIVGAHLSYCNKNRTSDELQDMDEMHNLLMEGV